MRRRTALLVVAGAGVAIALAPPAAPPPAAPPPAALSTQADHVTATRPIASAVLACPELSITDDSALVLAGLVVPDPDPSASAGPASAVLRGIDAEADVARLEAPGEPASLLVAGRSQPPILLQARGAWAPGAVAGVASRELAGAGAGLASVACPAPGPQWWFVGAGSQLGRGAALLVNNPAQEPARFDLRLFARSGPIDALAGKGIDLGPRAYVRLRLDALAEGQDLLAVQVLATGGRIAASLRDVAVPRGESPRGVDFIPPALAPSTALVVPGIPGGDGARELVLVNPGSQFATVIPRLLTESGPAELPGLASVAVPAGSVISIQMEGVLAGRPGSLVLASDVPVTGGLSSSWGTSIRDLAWLSAVPAVRPPNSVAAAAVVPAGEGLTTTVTVAAPEAAVSGTLSVATTGSASESIFSATGPLAQGDLDGGGPAAGPIPYTSGATTPTAIRVDVPAGAQRTVELPGLAEGAVGHVWWRSDPGTGPAVLSHLTRSDEGPEATGYSWWPTVSAVLGVPVREDVGTLAPVQGSVADDALVPDDTTPTTGPG